MQQYRIQGKVLNWVKHFLTDRQQRVFVNGSKSSGINITRQCPGANSLSHLYKWFSWSCSWSHEIICRRRQIVFNSKQSKSVSTAKRSYIYKSWNLGWGLANDLQHSEMSLLTHRQSRNWIQIWNGNKRGKICNRTCNLWAGLRSISVQQTEISRIYSQ